MIGGSQVSVPASRRRKVREKKPQQKWSLLYTIPVNILNQTATSNLGDFNKKGKRNGFSVYDSLVCKKCKPNKFFHTRFSLKTHSFDDHSVSGATEINVISRERRRKVNIECIDLDDENDSDDEPAEISIIDEDDEVCELIETVRITPDSEHEIECLNIDNYNEDTENENGLQVSSIENNASYQPKVLLKDIWKERSRDETQKTTSELVTIEIEEITLGDDDDDVVEERGRPHIRNLLKEFEVSQVQENKRKENFEESTSKKACLDELLLAEEILVQDVLEVSMEENNEVIDVEDDSIVICDNFPSKEIPNEDDLEDSVVILV